MKKVLCILLVLVMCLSVTACGSSAYDPVGEYINLSPFVVGVYTDFLLQDSGNVQSDLTIENKDGTLSFVDLSYIGSVEIVEDSLVLHRVESAETGAAKEVSDNLLNNNPSLRDVEYFICEDCLIGKSSSMTVVSGDLPTSGFADFSLEPTFNGVNPYCIDFFDDGSCEVEGECGFDDYVFTEGQYEINGQFITIILKSMEYNNESYTGEHKYVLFIKDGIVYSDVNKKI